MSIFRKATKSQARLRMALVGPSGSGKTYSALAIAAGLGPRVAVIDTEHGSASKYSHRFAFDTVALDNFDPRNYIAAIEAAAAEGFDVLIIDSLSHAWTGKGGELEMVDRATKRSRSGNSYTAWREVTPLHNLLVDTILQSGCHVIATMRTKVDYVLQPDASTGKLTPKKVGLAPIQREGMDYEFDIVGDLDLEHNLIIGKTRCDELDGFVKCKPGKDLGETLRAWLSDGTPMAERPRVQPVEMIGPNVVAEATSPTPPTAAQPGALGGEAPADEPSPADPNAPPPSTPDQHRAIMGLVSRVHMTNEDFTRMILKRGVETLPEINGWDANEIIRKLGAIVERMELVATGGAVGDSIRSAPAQAGTIEDGPAAEGSTTEESTPDDHLIPEASREEKAAPARKPGKGRKPAGSTAAQGGNGEAADRADMQEEALAN